MEKERLDIVLVDRGLFETREKARSSIMAGVVYVNGEKSDKAGSKIGVDSEIAIKENVNPYVSRGGLKLEKALKVFSINLKGKVAIDIGASTGGFTDCMLKNGSVKVYAVDVGYGQLAWQLRQDPRVVCMERTNIRYITAVDISEPLDFGSVDVSFISLKLVLPVAYNLLKEGGEMVCLIKPQFEAGRDKVGKKGVVRDPIVHNEVIQKIADFSIQQGFSIKGIDYSPIKGPEGNIEYLLYLLKDGSSLQSSNFYTEIEDIVKSAHGNL